MYRRLIVPVDGSAFAEYALAAAAHLARAAHAEIHLVSVHYAPLFAVDLGSRADVTVRAGTEAYVTRLAQQLTRVSGVEVRTTVPQGVPADAICDYAESVADALIVMTTHGRTGFSRAWIGSVADAVLKRSRHAVLMLRPPEQPPAWHEAPAPAVRRVLVPLDGTPFAEIALPPATWLAETLGSHLDLLRIIEPQPVPVVTPVTMPYTVAPTLISDTLDTLVQQGEVYVRDTSVRLAAEHPRLALETHVLVSESVSQGILEHARMRADDVVAMATHRRGVSRLVVPSVADKVIRGGPDAVLLVTVTAD